jgi:hypothetical protein
LSLDFERHRRLLQVVGNQGKVEQKEEESN